MTIELDKPCGWRYVSGFLKDKATGTEYAIHASMFDVGGHRTSHASVRTRDGAFVVAEVGQKGVVGKDGVTFESPGLAMSFTFTSPLEIASVTPPDRASSKTHECAPNSSVTGIIRVGDKVVDVEGSLWYDAESLESGHSPAWDWASIRLDNGLRLYVYALSGAKAYAVTVDGASSTRYENVSVTAYDSYLSYEGRVYPTKIEITVENYGRFYLAPWLENQEIKNSITPYYEGACDVLEGGKKIGVAFVEYVGRPRETEESLLVRWCRGDKDAAVALRELAHGSQLADDFVDKDSKDFKDKSGHMLDFLTFALGRLPNNPFYQKYRATLEPLVLMSILYWDLSNYLVTQPFDNSRYYAYAYREMLEQVMGMTAYIVGGLEHARRTMREVNRFYHVMNVDPFEKWWAEVSNV